VHGMDCSLQHILHPLADITEKARRCSSAVARANAPRAGLPPIPEQGPHWTARTSSLIAFIAALQVPDWFLNRQRDFRDGKTQQIVSSTVDSKLREDFERLKKIRFAPDGSWKCLHTHSATVCIAWVCIRRCMVPCLVPIRQPRQPPSFTWTSCDP
jgi:hypothetical protein